MKAKSLADWVAISEILGSIAVVISLVFVGNSVNQNTMAVRSANEKFLYEISDDRLRAMSENEDLASIVVKVKNNEDLSQIDLHRYQSHMRRYLNMWEVAYYRNQEGNIDSAVWRDFDKGFAAEILKSYRYEWWEDSKSWYGPEFIAHVDAVYSNTESPEGVLENQ